MCILINHHYLFIYNPQTNIIFIMNDIQRLTLVSDPTDEFPKNANNSFKVRLPERLILPGDQWHAHVRARRRIEQWRDQPRSSYQSGPIRSMTMCMCMTIRKKVLGTYRQIEFKREEYAEELEDVMCADLFVTSGVLFWQRVMQAVHNKVMIKVAKEKEDALTDDRDEIPIVSIKKNWMPTLSWKGETLILHAIPKVELMNSAKTTALTSFAINYSIAEKFGFVIKTPVGGYKLGPNLQFTLADTTFTDSTEPADPSMLSNYNWNGEHFVGIQPIDLKSRTTNKLFKVENKRLQLSLLVEWRFNNLNASFEKIVVVRQRTVMVYSDVVESSVVGSGKFFLLREVPLSRTGDGRSTVEPCITNGFKSQGINWISSGDCNAQQTLGHLTPW